MNTEYLHRLALYARAGMCIVRSRFLTGRPFFISHLITTRCFARCPYCLWRGETPEEADTGKIIDFYRRARRLGFVSTTFWGGEPLLRDDIFDIAAACRKLGFVTGLITNGYLLPHYAGPLARDLYFLIVSLDIPGPEHDVLRGVPGLFENISSGIRRVQQENPRLKVFINSVISRCNHEYVEQLIGFAETHSLTITFESVNAGPAEFPRSESRDIGDWRLSPPDEMNVFGSIRKLKRAHPAINNSHSYLRLFESGQVRYRCHAPRISIRIEPDGAVTNCRDRDHPLGNVYTGNLEDILSSPRFREVQRNAETCSACVDTGVIESSLFWEFNREVMVNSAKLFLR